MSSWGRCQDRIWDAIEYYGVMTRRDLVRWIYDVSEFDRDLIESVIDDYLEDPNGSFVETEGFIRIRG